MQGLNTPSTGSAEASSFLRRPEELRRFLDDIIRVASQAKSLLESCRGPLEARNSRTQPPRASDSRSPRRLYSFCFFCGQSGHIRANCDLCKEYLAAGKCLLVNGRVVLPTGQEIPREVTGRTLKDCLDSWDLGNQSTDIQIPPSSPGWLISLEDPHLSVHPNTPSEQPLCAPLSVKGPSHRSAPEQPQVPTRTPTVSSSSGDGLLCCPRSPPRTVPTSYSHGRPRSRSHSRSRDFDDLHQYLYSSRPHSRDSRDSHDYRYYRSPSPALRLTYSRLPEISTLVRQLDRVVTSSSYSNRPSHSSWESAHSGRRYSRGHTPQPSRRVY